MEGMKAGRKEEMTEGGKEERKNKGRRGGRRKREGGKGRKRRGKSNSETPVGFLHTAWGKGTFVGLEPRFF